MNRYTEKARNAIFFAHYEAGRQGADKVQPEHLLLSLLRVDAELFRRFSAQKPNAVEDIYLEIAPDNIKRRESWTSPEPTTLAPATETLLNLAAEEALKLNQAYIGTEHLLLSFFRNGSPRIIRVLNQYGLDAEHLTELIKKGDITSQGQADDGYDLISQSGSE